MRISVIIPTCDRPKEFLQQAILSVCKQTVPPHEIIIVDNGTRPVKAEDLPPEVSLYQAEPLAGPSRARNVGARIATGSHLAFLDDDDWWCQDFLKEASNVSRSGNYQCVYGKIIHLKDGIQIEKKNLTPETAAIDELLRTNPGTGGINILISKDLFEQVGGFDEQLRVSEDRALAIEILRAGVKIGIAPRALSYARFHEGEHQKDKNPEKVAFILKYRSLMPLPQFLRQYFKYRIWIHMRAARKKVLSRNV